MRMLCNSSKAFPTKKFQVFIARLRGNTDISDRNRTRIGGSNHVRGDGLGSVQVRCRGVNRRMES